ncbi:MAG: DMT family transporter [Eubacteriales bacterium]|nr:DMT family transporter [Eubacteriales bacterium]
MNDNTKQNHIKGDLMLLLAALIWGSAFVAQKKGGYIGTFTYNGIRSLLGGFFLLPVIYFLDKNKAKQAATSDSVSLRDKKKERKELMIAGLVCGVAVFAGNSLQQYGINYTDVGKAGFITSLYTVIVPFFAVLLGKRVTRRTWGCAFLGVIGFYFLSMKGFELSVGRGDLAVLLSAIGYSVQILAVDHFASRVDGVKLSCLQFLVSGVISLFCMFAFEDPRLGMIMGAWAAIAYGGILSCGVGYTLQIVGQKDAEPTQATLIMCLESVFSALFGALLLHENLGGRGYLGCAIIFTAVIVSNLPMKASATTQKDL